MLFEGLLLFNGSPFTRAHAKAVGWTASYLRSRLKAGLIRHVLRTVYVDVVVPDSLALRAEALCLVTPKDAVVCRQTAAWLYGIDTLALDTTDGLPPVELLRPADREHVHRAWSIGHSQTVHPGDVTVHRGLRVTTPVATAVHLARHLRRPFALSAVDAMLHAGLVNRAELLDAVKRYPGHPGIKQARELVWFSDPLTESPGESWLRLRLLDAGFPRPQAQVRVTTAVGERRIDLGYPDRLYRGLHPGLEYDSDQWHTGKAALRRDESRQLELEGAGWSILPVRRGDVWGHGLQLEYAVGEVLNQEPRLPRRW